MAIEERNFVSAIPAIITSIAAEEICPKIHRGKSFYLVSKRAFDVLISVLALPILVTFCCLLLPLNIWWNPGSLLFFQERRGRDGQPFVIVKFRTMSNGDGLGKRHAYDSLETNRITRLGRWLRQTKIDELPQIVNVLLGHMSIIGPRPEVYAYAEEYRQSISGYSAREIVKPGLTGYAQVVQGYTDSIEAVRLKTQLDIFYVRSMGWKLDLYVLLATIRVVFNPSANR